MPETPPRLFHFSDDPAIRRFEPHVAGSSASTEALVWAVHPVRAYLYYFPRDCPRVTYYASERTSEADRACFFAHTTATRVAAIEAGWLEPLRSARLYRYEFPAQGFELHDEVAGYWVSREAVVPAAVEPVGDLLSALAEDGVEIRVTPSLWPLYEAVIASTLEFSVIRWRNAAHRT